MKVSVVIPTHNLKATLLECIKSITKQDYPSFEIIVVDNASTDGTTEAVTKKFPEVKLIRNHKNLGVTGGRNVGLKNASGEYIFFFDHDMVAETEMISGLVKVAESNPQIGVVTPKIYYFEDKKRIWAAGTGVGLWTGQVVFRGGEDVGQYDKVEEVQVAPAAILVKRKVVEKVGDFDDIYFATYEDTDFCFRVKKEGFKIFYAPKAVAFHKIPANKNFSMERLLSRTYFIGRNRVIFMKKYGKNFPVFLSFLPVYFGYYLFLSIRFQKREGIIDFLKGTLDGVSLALNRKI